MKIEPNILTVLGAAVTDGNRLVLTGQLDRKTYEAANKVLTAIGGKWNRSAKAHLFEGDAAEVVDQVLMTGEYSRTKQDFGQFDTPKPLAEEIVSLADIRPGMQVLEPSAGIGNIAEAALFAGAEVACFEIDRSRAEKLREMAAKDWGDAMMSVVATDFLSIDPSPAYDRVVMNPPFAKQADIDHVLHAAKFLAPGGKLVAIMSASALYRSNRKTEEFREWVAAQGGTIEPLPENSFASSGTKVNTVLVRF